MALDLARRVKIWVEWDDTDSDHPNWLARYYGGSAAWKLRPDKDPGKANCIEILSLRRITLDRQPVPGREERPRQSYILHEFSHAIHFDLLRADNPAVKEAYGQAMDRKLYEEAEYFDGRKGKPYARTNQNEYFAELSCAYLRRCDWYPFTREDMERVWGRK